MRGKLFGNLNAGVYIPVPPVGTAVHKWFKLLQCSEIRSSCPNLGFPLCKTVALSWLWLKDIALEVGD